MSYNARVSADIAALLEERLAQAHARGHRGAVLNISIENLPMIISSHGSDATEHLFEGLMGYIKNHLMPDDALWRNDKDHLTVHLAHYPSKEIEPAIKRLTVLLRNYGCLNVVEPLQLVCRIGAVTVPDMATNAEEALDRAYVALNDAREGVSHYVMYADVKRHQIESKNQLVLANYIQHAFLNQRLRLAYQPIVDAKTGNISSYECLLRIINPDGSLSSAGPFVPVAEKMGFIDVIDSFVLELVLKELHNDPHVHLSVNLSNVTIMEPEWLEFAKTLLSDPAIASRLTIEIIETAEQKDVIQAARFVRSVKDLGCKVALDDFGAGYTSFSQLKHLPVDTIKIDGSFIRTVNENEHNRFFVKTLLDFASNFGLSSVAEYIENKELADTLRSMNVDYMQGNYFSPAMEFRS